MKKMIVTTTINPPTEAIRKYDAMADWELLVVGDKKTPEYVLQRGTFLPWSYVFLNYRDLWAIIGENSVRLGRMVAFIEAYRRGADIVASIDDDVMPDDDWGKDVVLGEEIEALKFECEKICFDPLEPYQYNRVAHRGFPLDIFNYAHQQSYELGATRITPLVREDICKGQSDFHAIDRIGDQMDYHCKKIGLPPHFADCFSPINTQNTFIHRSALKDFPANIPFIGRADDIWAGYIFQALHPRSTVYGRESAEHQQERSVQSLVNDLEEEIFLYRNTYGFLESIMSEGLEKAIARFIPAAGIAAINVYRSYFDEKV